MTGRWVSPGTPVSSTNKTDLHDITEILLKVALNTVNPITLNTNIHSFLFQALGLVIAAFGIVIAIGSKIFGGYIEPLFQDGTASVGSFFSYVAISAAVLGSLILILAMIGACGACCKNSCLLYGVSVLFKYEI